MRLEFPALDDEFAGAHESQGCKSMRRAGLAVSCRKVLVDDFLIHIPQDPEPLQQQFDFIFSELFHGVINDDTRTTFQGCKNYVAPQALLATLPQHRIAAFFPG